MTKFDELEMLDPSVVVSMGYYGGYCDTCADDLDGGETWVDKDSRCVRCNKYTWED